MLAVVADLSLSLLLLWFVGPHRVNSAVSLSSKVAKACKISTTKAAARATVKASVAAPDTLVGVPLKEVRTSVSSESVCALSHNASGCLGCACLTKFIPCLLSSRLFLLAL